MALWPSSQERWPLPGRKVKNSLKIFLWVMIPVTSPSNMMKAAKVDNQRPHGWGISSWKWKR
ncbi:hypothetical protein D9M73_291120 [compost metagenome]